MKQSSHISLSEVGQYINRKDNRSIKKWLRDHQIPIHKDGREYVFRLHVEQEVWRPFAEDLVKKISKFMATTFRINLW